jgi:TrmH family RNA methyltransferase
MKAGGSLTKLRSSPLIKQARVLRRRGARHETGLFLVEGIHQVGAAIEAGWEIEAILYAPETLKSPYALELIGRFAGRVEPVSAALFLQLSEKENPQGIVAIAKQRHTGLDKLSQLIFGAALVSPQDPGNVGTVLRTLDAVGGHALLLLDGGVDQFHPTVIRASMGACFWVPIVEAGFSEFQQFRLEEKWQLIGTAARATLDYRNVIPRQPWILLLGSEQKGLTEEQKDACDYTVSLPMRGHSSSLNLGVAAGVVLYTFAG